MPIFSFPVNNKYILNKKRVHFTFERVAVTARSHLYGI